VRDDAECREDGVSTRAYDRSADDLGNIVNLGHVNFHIPDQSVATLFYIEGLGLTRDPYMMSGVDNMWVNVGGWCTIVLIIEVNLAPWDKVILPLRLSTLALRAAGNNVRKEWGEVNRINNFFLPAAELCEGMKGDHSLEVE
jgi:hypothetical protein